MSGATKFGAGVEKVAVADLLVEERRSRVCGGWGLWRGPWRCERVTTMDGTGWQRMQGGERCRPGACGAEDACGDTRDPTLEGVLALGRS